MNSNIEVKTGWSYIILFFVLLFLSFFVLRSSVSAADPDQYMKVTVQPGDTLWGISEKYDQFSSMSHSRFIEWTEKVNHVTSTKLIPGQSLIIPVEK